MKKILLTLVFMIAGSATAQYYPTNNSYENSTYDGWGNDGDYFPDDYYYDYPTDYYPQNYYQSYYNDYRNSIVSIDWSQFFRQYRLSRFQIDQINHLNTLFPSFSSWNYYYGANPDRWYYDRFSALQQILGQRYFAVFQKNYYRGYSPIVYFQNYRQTYYIPRYKVRTQYRYVNINKYRVDKNNYRNSREKNGLYDPNNRNYSNNNGTNNIKRSSSEPNNRNSNNGFRNPASAEQTAPTRITTNSGGTRDNSIQNRRSDNSQSSNAPVRQESRSNDNGFRDGNSSSRSNVVATKEPTTSRSDTSVRGGGFR